MNKEEFKILLERALQTAAQNAEKKLGRRIPRKFEIVLHGLAPTSRILGTSDALDEIYLGPDRFFRIIDLSISRVSKDVATVYMAVSGHPPGPLSQTWNQPPGSGPFKQTLAETVKVVGA